MRSHHETVPDTVFLRIPWLAQKNERIDILSVMEERGLQDLVQVNGKKVRLKENPENLRVRGKAGKRK